MARFVRLGECERQAVNIEVDGRNIEALAGDTLMVAMLTHSNSLRREEFGGGARAGFCLMGACQDCWVWAIDGTQLRACSTTVAEGMRLTTRPAPAAWATLP